MDQYNDEYIYLLKVERADKNKQINAEAEYKNASTQAWADLNVVEFTMKSCAMTKIGWLRSVVAKWMKSQ